MSRYIGGRARVTKAIKEVNPTSNNYGGCYMKLKFNNATGGPYWLLMGRIRIYYGLEGKR
ncbi:MAG: hypothetical protein FWE37_02540 [Spirochaetaceae bacterium]|nr:hypothetical protein [Spirochaetaceae bacterium]